MTRQRLPNRRVNVGYAFELDGQKYRATAGFFADGRFAEIFLDVGKAGSTVQLHAATSAILTSLCLQHGVDAETIQHAVNGPIAIALDHFRKIAVL
jgi:hypothetical protein